MFDSTATSGQQSRHREHVRRNWSDVSCVVVNKSRVERHNGMDACSQDEGDTRAQPRFLRQKGGLCTAGVAPVRVGCGCGCAGAKKQESHGRGLGDAGWCWVVLLAVESGQGLVCG